MNISIARHVQNQSASSVENGLGRASLLVEFKFALSAEWSGYDVAVLRLPHLLFTLPTSIRSCACDCAVEQKDSSATCIFQGFCMASGCLWSVSPVWENSRDNFEPGARIVIYDGAEPTYMGGSEGAGRSISNFLPTEPCGPLKNLS